MKAIMYISKVAPHKNGKSIPIDLARIYSQSRHSNSQRNVTGALSYRVGHYLQIIEGSDDIIDDLYSKISKDNRHSEPTIIINSSISERAFQRWSMKLLQPANNDSDFRNFIDIYRSEISKLSFEKKVLVGKFFKLHHPVINVQYSYKGKTVALHGWPNYISMEQTPHTIELCATIMNSAKPYDYLVNSGLYGSEANINKVLDELFNQDLLTISEAHNETEKPPTSKEKETTGFYSKMKTFLGLGRKIGL